MSGPVVKGWCPGAWRPMMSGDGLVVRIRPRLARLTRAQVLGLCDLAGRFGSGVIDLTNRANLQIRGVAEELFEDLLQGLAALDLVEADPGAESRRNILVSPFWETGDLTCRLAGVLARTLPLLPDLPEKFGFSVDCGPTPILRDAPADLRLERGADGLMLRLDGASRGRPVTEDGAADALIEMATWFAARHTPDDRRMARVVARTRPPEDWTVAPALPPQARPRVGAHPMGALLGAVFGQIDADALARTVRETGAPGLRCTPWRLFLLEGAAMPEDAAFVTRADDPMLSADACPGAPYCPQATVETRILARRIALRVKGSLHVSGCAKGCARPTAATTTFVGRSGRFDLVKNGCAWDAPQRSGLSPEDILGRTRTGAD